MKPHMKISGKLRLAWSDDDSGKDKEINVPPTENEAHKLPSLISANSSIFVVFTYKNSPSDKMKHAKKKCERTYGMPDAKL